MIRYLTPASAALGSFFFIAARAYEEILTVSTPMKIVRRLFELATKSIPASATSKSA